MTTTIDFGPLAPLVDDPAVHEIVVTAPDAIHIWHEDRGREAWDHTFTDEQQLSELVQHIAASLDVSLSPEQPIINQRLPDGSRVQIVIPPVSARGTVLFISQPAGKGRMTMERLVEVGAISAEAAEFLRACVRARANILVLGGFNSGIRTMLNVLVDQIPAQSRIAVIQSSSTPLVIDHRYAIVLETRLPGIDGRQSVTADHLFNVALRMQPDRFVLTDIDGGEVPRLLNAMSAGFATQLAMYADSPLDALSQLEMRAIAANPTSPALAVREHISRSLNILVQMSFMDDGFKRVGAISEVQGLQAGSITVKPVFQYQKTDMAEDGRFIGGLVPTGVLPLIADRFESYGIAFDQSLFKAVS